MDSERRVGELERGGKQTDFQMPTCRRENHKWALGTGLCFSLIRKIYPKILKGFGTRGTPGYRTLNKDKAIGTSLH